MTTTRSATAVRLAAQLGVRAKARSCYQYRKAPQHTQGTDNLPDDYEVCIGRTPAMRGDKKRTFLASISMN